MMAIGGDTENASEADVEPTDKWRWPIDRNNSSKKSGCATGGEDLQESEDGGDGGGGMIGFGEEEMGAFIESTKIGALVEDLRKVREEDVTCKSLVFSQFTMCLDLIELALQRGGFDYARLDGAFLTYKTPIAF
jgi:SNF2 family DNA or RNA helicase